VYGSVAEVDAAAVDVVAATAAELEAGVAELDAAVAAGAGAAAAEGELLGADADGAGAAAAGGADAVEVVLPASGSTYCWSPAESASAPAGTDRANAPMTAKQLTM